MDEKQSIVVAGVVHNNGKFLVLKRSSSEDIFPNKWELPSGKVNFGEDPNKALVREMREETGLIPINFFPFKITHYTIEKPNKRRHTVQIICLVNCSKQSNIVVSREHDEYKWISPNELSNLDTFDDIFEILDQASKFLHCDH